MKRRTATRLVVASLIPLCYSTLADASGTAGSRSRIVISSRHGSGSLGSWPRAGSKKGLAAGVRFARLRQESLGNVA